MKLLIPIIITISLIVGVTLGRATNNPVQVGAELVAEKCPVCVCEINCGPEAPVEFLPIGVTDGIRTYHIPEVGDFKIVTNEDKVYKRVEIEDNTPLFVEEPITILPDNIK